jgi:hypothetical protein
MTDDALHEPPPLDPQNAAVIAGWVAGALSTPIRDPAEAERAAQAAGELADDLAGLDAAGRLAVLRAMPRAGVLRVLSAMADGLRAVLAADLAQASVAERELRTWLYMLCDEAVRLDAAETDEAVHLLRPGCPASTLLVAYHGSGDAGRYVDAVAAAASGGTAGVDAGLRRLVAVLGTAVMPAEISRLAACLYDAVTERFDNDVALALVRGHLFVRLIAPAVGKVTGSPDELGAAIARVANGEQPDAAQEAMDWLADQAVRAGRLAEEIVQDGEDPEDLFVLRGAALQDELSLDATFAEPTPPDPLGTLPAIAVNALGTAIKRVRTRRFTAYDWAVVAAFAEADPFGHAILLTDERCQVLDLLL